jgi:hypothetical protein
VTRLSFDAGVTTPCFAVAFSLAVLEIIPRSWRTVSTASQKQVEGTIKQTAFLVGQPLFIDIPLTA